MKFTAILCATLAAAAPIAQEDGAASLGSFLGETTGSLVAVPFNLVNNLGTGVFKGLEGFGKGIWTTVSGLGSGFAKGVSRQNMSEYNDMLTYNSLVVVSTVNGNVAQLVHQLMYQPCQLTFKVLPQVRIRQRP
jgi:hypothetical protein